MIRHSSIALPLLLAAAPLAAQQSAATDSGRVVLETRLGGDSMQAARVELRRGATYRVEFRPATAQLLIRKRVRDGSAAPALDTLPRDPRDSVSGWRTYRVTARENGEHVLELTNPGTPASVRMVLMHRNPGDTLPTRLQLALLFNENVSGGPVYIALDSGHIYRIQAVGGPIYLSPRASYRAPLRFVPMGGTTAAQLGTPFMAPFTGQYRAETDPGTDASFRIYSAEGDAQAAACVQDPRGATCIGNPQTHRPRYAPFVVAAFIPLIFLVNAISR